MKCQHYLVLVAVMGLLAACGDTEPERPSVTAMAEAVGKPTIEVAEPAPVPTVEPQSRVAHYQFDPEPPTLLEERILEADVIVRARLTSTTAAAELLRHSYEASARTTYGGVLKFNFQVSEYIKGTGPNAIVAVADYHWGRETKAEAEAKLPELLGMHDPQWDDREALVFLKTSNPRIPGTVASDRFFLAHMDFFDTDQYSIASPHNKLWLPAARPNSEGPARQSNTGIPVHQPELTFLLDAPTNEPVVKSGSSTATEDAPNIKLRSFKAKVTALQTELATGATEEYKECVKARYTLKRLHEYVSARNLREDPNWVYGGRIGPDNVLSMDSGLAADSVLYSQNKRTAPPPAELSKHDVNWIDSHDHELFTAKSPDWNNTLKINRPLPKGEVQVLIQSSVRQCHAVRRLRR